MLVDDYEKYNNDQQDVVDINADETVEEAATEPTADDCTLYPLPGYHFRFFAKVQGELWAELTRNQICYS